MTPRVRRQSLNLSKRQPMDVFTDASRQSEGAVLLWHGSGPRERRVMSPLADGIAASGLAVHVPDWSSDAKDRGVADLLRSLDFVINEHQSQPAPSRLVLAGWSAGASAAMATALRGEEEQRPSTVVAISGRYDIPGPLGEDSVMNMAMDPPHDVSIRLVHGRRDDRVPVDQSVLLSDALSTSGWSSTLRLVDANHAGVIGCEFDPELGLCVPSKEAGSREVLREVVGLFDTDS